MTTDSGLTYLSGLLRAGAEPVGAGGRAPRSRAAAQPRANTSPHASPYIPPATVDRTDADEASRPLDTDAVERAAHTTVSQVNADAGIENQSREKVSGYASSTFTPDARPAVEGKHENLIPATRHATGAVGEARADYEEAMGSRAKSEDEMRSDKTEHTAVVTEHATVASSEEERLSGTPRLLAVEWSPAPLQAETSNSAARRAAAAPSADAPAADGMVTTHAADMRTLDTAPVFLGTSPARNVAARHEQPARVFHAPPKDDSPRRGVSGFAESVESDATRTGESARGIADPTLYTLEAHVERLRALMQTTGAEAPDGMSESAAAVTGAARRAAADTLKETRPPHAPARRARESPRGGGLRPESSEQPPAALSPKSGSRQSVVPERSEQFGVVQPREGGTPGEVTAGGTRAPKFTIGRLDVQVVNRADPSPPARPSPPAPSTAVASSRPDPWGAPDRHFLGRFFY